MTSAFDNAGSGEVPVRHQSDQEEVITSAISWGAIVAGAVAATAATVILLCSALELVFQLSHRGMVRARLL